MIPLNMKRIIKEYCEQLQLTNVIKNEPVPFKTQVNELLQGYIDHLSSPTSIKSIINNLSKQKSPGPDGFRGEFYQILRKKLNQPPFISFRRQKQKKDFLTRSLRPALP